MPTPTPTDDRQTIAMPAEGKVLKAIRAYAAENDLPLGRSALELLDQGLNATAMLAELDPEEEATPAIVDLSTVPADWLTEEIARRLSAAATSATRIAAEVARADEAERRVARVQAVILGAD